MLARVTDAFLRQRGMIGRLYGNSSVYVRVIPHTLYGHSCSSYVRDQATIRFAALLRGLFFRPKN